MADEELGSPFAVGGNVLGQGDAEGFEGLGKGPVGLVFKGDGRSLGQAGGHDGHGVVGRGIAVDADHVEAVVDGSA